MIDWMQMADEDIKVQKANDEEDIDTKKLIPEEQIESKV